MLWKFQHKEFFYLFILLVVMIIIVIINEIRRKKILSRLGDYSIIMQLMPESSSAKKRIKFSIWVLAVSFLITGLCNLQSGNKSEEVTREGADIVVCLDVSKSMLAEDIQPNRLTRAVMALEKFIDELKGDRIGLIVFAGHAYVQLPMTTDYGAAKIFLSSISPEMVPVQGTNIAEAMTKAMECFDEENARNKSIILITDGESHEEDAVKKAEEAAEKQIMVNTIGIGSENGVPIPEIRNGKSIGYKKDKEGNTVITKLNTKILMDLASASNGVFVKATNNDLGLKSVMKKIEELDKKKLETTIATDFNDQFRIFFFSTLFLLIIESLISEKKSKIWNRLNLFKEEK
jgi:Ca-activated chloride channel homolog